MRYKLEALWNAGSMRVFGVATSAAGPYDVLLSTAIADGLFCGKRGLGLNIGPYEQGVQFPLAFLNHMLREHKLGEELSDSIRGIG